MSATRKPCTPCGTWQEFESDEHEQAWREEHRELTGHDIDPE